MFTGTTGELYVSSWKEQPPAFVFAEFLCDYCFRRLLLLYFYLKSFHISDNDQTDLTVIKATTYCYTKTTADLKGPFRIDSVCTVLG